MGLFNSSIHFLTNLPLAVALVNAHVLITSGSVTLSANEWLVNDITIANPTTKATVAVDRREHTTQKLTFGLENMPIVNRTRPIHI